MKVWIFVEGESDRKGLEALFGSWRSRLHDARWGLQIMALGGKSEYLKKIGDRVASRLKEDIRDVVVAAPDLYPMRPFDEGPYAHHEVSVLAKVMERDVEASLIHRFKVPTTQVASFLGRFHATALKHDLEMLLLAVPEELARRLGTTEKLTGWRQPVENQNDGNPPGHIVETLFKTKSIKRRTYAKTTDAAAVLGKVRDLRSVLYTQHGQLQCPFFKTLLDWVGNMTSVPVYRD